MWLRCGNRKEIVEREGSYRISSSLVENPNEMRPIRFIDYHLRLPVFSYSSHLLKRRSASNVQKRQSLNKELKEHFHADDCNLDTPIFVRIQESTEDNKENLNRNGHNWQQIDSIQCAQQHVYVHIKHSIFLLHTTNMFIHISNTYAQRLWGDDWLGIRQGL